MQECLWSLFCEKVSGDWLCISLIYDAVLHLNFLCHPYHRSNFFGSGQRTVNNKSQDQVLTLARIDETVKYMEMVNISPEYKNVRTNCINRDRDCAFWWAVGECAINKEYMDLFCAPTCQTCHMIHGFNS